TPSPTPTLSASSPSLAAPTSSPSASWICAGSGLSDASEIVTTFGAGTFFMAVPPVLADLVGACHARNASGRGGRTAFKLLREPGQPPGDGGARSGLLEPKGVALSLEVVRGLS